MQAKLVRVLVEGLMLAVDLRHDVSPPSADVAIRLICAENKNNQLLYYQEMLDMDFQFPSEQCGVLV